MMEFKPVSERIAYLRIKARPFNISLVNGYAPTEKARGEKKEVFYEKIEEEIEKLPREDTLILLGDFNAQIGKEDYLKQVAGKHTIHERTNDNGQRLCSLAARSNMIISSTKFKHPNRHKVTWIAPDQRICTQIDHVLVIKRKQSSIKDVRTHRGACADSDHFMVTATIKQKIKRTKNTRDPRRNWDIESLSKQEVKEKYVVELEETIKKQSSETGDIDEAWNRMKKGIIQAAEKQIGIKRSSNKRGWYDEECHDMLSEKRKARQKWLNTSEQADRDNYEKVRKECNKRVRKKKRNWMEDEIKEIEKENRNKNTKVFYKKINKQNKTYRGRIRGGRNKDGKVTEDAEEYKKVWAEYFKELLNDSSPNEEVEIEEDEGETVTEPTMEEVKEVINKSQKGKSPGKGGINMELIKYGGEELQKQIHLLIQKIWREEKMPEEWESGQIVTIHKKGDQRKCENYRGITLLNTAYKILSTIIQRRLADATKGIVGQYQCGFTRGRSTIDAIHIIKQIMEKAYESRIEMEMLFIDFERAFDSIRREKLMLALKELGIEPKLRRLVQMTMRETVVSIKTLKGETEEFKIFKGVRQGDSLSATLFNLALEYVTRNINKGTVRTRGGQLVAYADDIVLITKRRRTMKEMLEEITEEGGKMGLKLNEDKTKIMRLGKKAEGERIRIGGFSSEVVEKFKYLGVMVSNTGVRETEIEAKIQSANRAFHANRKVLKSKILGKKTKIKMYTTMIRPILMYDAETMTMTKKNEEDLRIAERKIMRAILGPIKTGDNEYRSRMNHELLQEMGGVDIVKKIKEQRVKWLGHIWRVGESATTYSMTEWDPGGRKRRGRPRSRWMQEVTNDPSRVEVDNWKEKTRTG